MKKLLIALLLVPGFQTLPQVRDVHTKFGWVINDLESHTHAGHPMRNEADPGNWAHELSHQISSDLREKTSTHDNAFYVLKGRYIRLMEPKVTLKQVADMIPKEQRGVRYKTYLVEARQWWSNESLYILDEATAYATGFQYHVESGTRDADRLNGAMEFLNYADAVVRAVKKYDPHYSQMKELEWYVNWNRERVHTLVNRYNGVVPPVDPPAPDLY